MLVHRDNKELYLALEKAVGKRIGQVENYYGGVFAIEHEGRYFWTIECVTYTAFEEIPKGLFDQLVSFEANRSLSDKEE